MLHQEFTKQNLEFLRSEVFVLFGPVQIDLRLTFNLGMKIIYLLNIKWYSILVVFNQSLVWNVRAIQRVHLRTEDASWLKSTKLFQLWIKEMTPTVDNNETSIRTKQEL